MFSYNFDGKILGNEESVIHPDNRSFRYGEGLFETIHLWKSKIPLWDWHWKRLIQSLPQLYFSVPVHFSQQKLKEEIISLAQKNHCAQNARVRITVFKGEGGIWEKPSAAFHYLLQCWPVEQTNVSLNENGLVTGIYTDGWKSCDAFSNLKHNNYLLYAMAAQYAKLQQWNEAILLNQNNRICEATIANVFFIKDGIIHTPHLKEGCVAGVMRSFLADKIKPLEGSYTIEDLLHADELFFTNAFNGIRWVKSLGNKIYTNRQTTQVLAEYISPLFV
ncbi:MAG: aminotransferase class IV [Lacibacter sp.]